VNVGVLGAGSWGTTVASLLAARTPTRLWAREAEVVESVRRHGENQLFLPGLPLPSDLRVTNDIAEVLDGADVVVVAVPAQHLRSITRQAQPSIRSHALVLSVAKGIELGSGRRMTEVLAEVLADHDPDDIGVLGGPNLAREVMAGQPSATCIAFPDITRAETLQALLTGDTLRVYTSHDVVGCEIGGAVKNVLATAAGAADGLGYGMNTQAALLTRGLAELTRLGVALGGQPLTFLGLTGNGDLIATCGSPQSRNRRVGEELAKGRPLPTIVSEMKMVAEGVETAPAVLELARRVGVEMPISATVAALLDGRLSPSDVVPTLMHREPTTELHGLSAESLGRRAVSPST
jgi:glycerol-3-phosphate dehydrogenase (NAD(P)+)